MHARSCQSRSKCTGNDPVWGGEAHARKTTSSAPRRRAAHLLPLLELIHRGGRGGHHRAAITCGARVGVDVGDGAGDGDSDVSVGAASALRS